MDLAALVSDKQLLAGLTREYELLRASNGKFTMTAALSDSVAVLTDILSSCSFYKL